MKSAKRFRTIGLAVILTCAVILLIAACASHAPAATQTPVPTLAVTPGTRSTIFDPFTTIEIPPFPYSTPLPPPISSTLDGLYSKTVPFEGTPVPCKRCAGYRLEGGVWTLYLDKGTFKVFHLGTGFTAVGSFSVSGDRITFFNDPYCEEDLRMAGIYSWATDGSTLTLQAVDDPCSIGLRAKNLTSAPWTRMPGKPSQSADPCQPPSREAAVTDHWPKPPGCK